MNIRHSNTPARPSSKNLFLVFLDPSNIKVSGTWVRKHLKRVQPPVSANGRKEERQFHFDSNQNVIFQGMGKDFTAEQVRKAVSAAVMKANELKCNEISVVWEGMGNPVNWVAITEALILTNYQFNTYKTKANGNSLKTGRLICEKELAPAVERGRVAAEATCITRDLVNEPVITLTAEELAKRAADLGKTYGFKTEILNKAKIQSLKMGGLLAVNYGSELPPTFTIMEYKPAGAVNKKPVVLVGKGVVYDTGGLSLKETAGSMDYMKSDMAGAGAVIGAMCGVAALGIPVHVVGLIPATDNRPGKNAYTPGDVIRMYDGTTVEVLNTDAEGRLILADALAYAKKYEPEIVIDLATLTGAAIIAVGFPGTVMCANINDEFRTAIRQAGEEVYERLVELPLWDEYREQLKSDIADMRNIGGKPAGSITAAKFLEHFTDYPWVHLDIAGPSFLPAQDGYRSKNGTGTGVRLLIQFIESLANVKNQNEGE